MTDQPQKIVALVDGSIYSSSVCDHAAWIASCTGAPVELIHVLGRREAADTQDHSGTIALGARTALLDQLAELDAQRAKLISHRGRAILEDAQAMVEKTGVIEVTTRLRHGDIVEAVADIEAEARVILIGKRGEAARDLEDRQRQLDLSGQNRLSRPVEGEPTAAEVERLLKADAELAALEASLSKAP